MKVYSVSEIEVVVKAINTHINDAGVCSFGCGALLCMALKGKNTS